MLQTLPGISPNCVVRLCRNVDCSPFNETLLRSRLTTGRILVPGSPRRPLEALSHALQPLPSVSFNWRISAAWHLATIGPYDKRSRMTATRGRGPKVGLCTVRVVVITASPPDVFALTNIARVRSCHVDTCQAITGRSAKSPLKLPDRHSVIRDDTGTKR